MIALFLSTVAQAASGDLSYSGRLVNADGSPVSGPVNLRFDVVYASDPSIVLCNKTLTGVLLSQGVFHTKLGFTDADCGGTPIRQILASVGAGDAVSIRVTDTTPLIDKAYGFQQLNSMPFAVVSEFAKSIGQMGATTAGQVLRWNGSQWVADTIDEVAAGAIGTPELADNSVTSAKIVDLTITGADIANGSIPDTKLNLADGAIPQSKISGLSASFTAKENSLGASTSSEYLAGDRAWRNFQNDVRTTFVGMGYAPIIAGGAVLSTDTLVTAIAKLDGRISTNETNAANDFVAASGDTMTGPLVLNADPSLALGAATKQYVDAQITAVSAGSSQWDNIAGGINYASGDVGVGTATPAQRLHVAAGNIRFDSGFWVGSNGNNNFKVIGSTSHQNSAGTFNVNLDGINSGSGDFNIRTGALDGAGALVFRVQRDGNVGIGVAAPTAKLEVAGNIKISGGIPGAGKVLTSDATGLATWETPAAAGITGLTGDVTGTGPGATATTIAPGAVTYAKTNFADGDIPQEKVNGLVGALAGKEPTIPTGTAAEYFRGDKTLQTLNTTVVPEGTNLYFSEPRVLATTLAGFTANTAQVDVSSADSSLVAFQKLQSSVNAILTGSVPFENNINLGGFRATNLAAPVDPSDATTKAYVDSAVSAGSSKWTTVAGGINYAGGSVGVGTTTPTQRIDVLGTADTRIAVRSSGTGSGTYSGYSIYNNVAAFFGGLFVENHDKTNLVVIAPTSFGVRTASVERLRITNSGDVGIGVAAPGAKLEVAGQVKITGGAPGAGKVLTSDATGLAAWQTPSAAGITALTGDVTGTGPGSTATTIAAGAVTYAKTNFADGIIPQVKIENLVTSLAAKEPVITAGTAAQYWAGTKSWQSFDASVRAAIMGVTYAPATIPPFNISTTDSFQTAISKLEKRIGDAETTLAASIPADNSVTSAKIADGTIVNADVAAAANIDAAKLGTGVVTTTEFNFLDGVTSSIQTQLTGKEPTVTGTGSTADFYSGNKTFRNLATDVRATPLTGYAVGTNSVLAATDTILGAFGKTQAQLNAISTSVTSLSASSWSNSAGNLFYNPGNVGVGTSSPTAKLEVASSAAAGTRVLAVNNTWVTEGVDPDTTKRPFEVRRSASSGEAVMTYVNDSSATIHYRNDEATSRLDLRVQSTDTEVGGGVNATDLTIMSLLGSVSGGRVGIGTTAPGAKLQVAGGIQLSDDAEACPGAANVKLGTLRYTGGTTLQLCVPTGWTNVGVATNRIVNGNYTGTGTGAFTVSLGFRPKIVVVKNVNGTYGGQVIAIDGIPDTATQLRNYDPNGVPNSANVGGVRITNTGFDATGTVNDSTFNVAGASYYYTAIGDAIVDSQWITNGANIYRNTGNVGIGTTNPTSKVSINGSTTYDGIRIDSTSNGFLHTYVNAGAGSNNGITLAGDKTIIYGGPAIDSPGGLVIAPWRSSVSGIRLDAAGNVGIGRANPAARLDVGGAVNFANGKGYLNYYNVNPYDQAEFGAIGATTSLSLVTNSISRMNINPAGNVGIGTVTPLQRLHVNGAIRTETAATDCPGGWTCTGYFWDMSLMSLQYTGLLARSDKRLKEEIVPLGEHDLEKLKKLRPVHYLWRDPKYGEGVKYGFIAQEVEEVWPSLVETATDAMGTKSMDYVQMISPLVKGFQKHDRDIASLKAENEALKRENAEIKARLERIEEALLNRSK